MLKKLASLVAALALCLILLPSQALAAELPDPPQPPVVEIPAEPETPEEPGVQVQSDEHLPQKEDEVH